MHVDVIHIRGGKRLGVHCL